jgi:outer membrane receptor for ferrienterochelin and colicins
MNKIRAHGRRAFLASLAFASYWGAPHASASTKSAPLADFGEMSLEQLMEIRIEKVFSASKYEQKVTRAPAAVTIVTADEIEKFGHRTIADVLRGVRGLYASNDSNYTYLGARGFLRPNDYNTRVLFLVDGHRVNDNIYDAFYIGHESSIDVDMVERVEVVRGPSSSIYGSNAFLGIINIVTKRGAQLEGGVVSAEIGSYDSYKGRVAVGGMTRKGIEWIFSASRYASGGRRNIYYPEFDPRISSASGAANNGVVEKWDAESADSVFARVNVGDVTIAASYNTRNKRVPTASFATVFNGGSQQTSDSRSYVDAKFDRSLSPDLQLLGRVFYDSYRYTGDYPFDYAEPGDPPYLVLNKDFSHGEWAGTEWQLNARMSDRYLVIAGGEYRENFHQDQFNYDYDPRTDYLSNHQQSRTLGLYAQVEATLTSKLVLNAGVRHDRYFGSFGGTTNPRFSLIYSPVSGTTLKALYGQAFRAPNAYERTFFAEQRNRPTLSPETIRTGELVWEQYLGRYYRFSLSGYRYNVDGLINQSITSSGLVFENLEGAEATGGEIEFEGRWDKGLTARVNYSHQRGKDGTGLELTSSPRDMAKLNVIVPFARERFAAGFEAQYHGAVTTLARQRAKDFVIGNLTLSAYEFPKGCSLSLSVYNVFDARAAYPGAEDHVQDVIQQDGRSLRMKLSYRF